MEIFFVVAYVIGAAIVGRWTAVRRKMWNHNHHGDEDDILAFAFASVFWPASAFYYLVTRPPRLSPQE